MSLKSSQHKQIWLAKICETLGLLIRTKKLVVHKWRQMRSFGDEIGLRSLFLYFLFQSYKRGQQQRLINKGNPQNISQRKLEFAPNQRNTVVHEKKHLQIISFWSSNYKKKDLITKKIATKHFAKFWNGEIKNVLFLENCNLLAVKSDETLKCQQKLTNNCFQIM